MSAIIGLGANLPSKAGVPKQTLCHALTLLESAEIEIKTTSHLYETPCFPAGAGPDYVNAVAMLSTVLSAVDLLSRLHRVEAEMGRERVSRWGQRTLDVDLLAYGEVIHPDLATFQHWLNLPMKEQSKRVPERLILPHPRIQDRAFVLVPLAEIAPDWRHPVLGRTAKQMRDDLEEAEVAQVKALERC
ncbi:2-amino-4-hydroxy-6-hydroxymethyldihydropteridine diphosphokinase [Profundibacter amoris]|uniref:2-amino-4-hydroxy-6-hydroxymethyldihydropteridine pyrophosphokinase n=1 Tax=Profundibacter amoris TaxID=2171755 RepID=A0A347UM02_9RHOB|nr:2-amino-4-hydroxy-6-hydroxymethyldihydropteridine diphosphokinase [Profundibacter amoris]